MGKPIILKKKKLPVLVKKHAKRDANVVAELITDKVSDPGRIKAREYKLFVAWLSIPNTMLGLEENMIESLGVTSETYKELMQIKTRKEFAKKYNVDVGTLSAWSKDVSAMESDKEMHKFFDSFTKKLIASFYAEQLKKPTPQGIETWYEIIKERSKSLNINLNGEMHHDLPDEEKNLIRDLIREAREARNAKDN